MANTRQTGATGEKLARGYLIWNGYAILATNWSTAFGELDIVAFKGGVLVFVEVKTRHSPSTESALASITANKHERMLKAVYQYLHDHEIDSEAQWRIDVIAVALHANRQPRIDHVEDAFDW